MIYTDKIYDFAKNVKDKDGAIMCIDYGEKNIGVAITDLRKKMSFPFLNLKNNPNISFDIFRIVKDKSIIAIFLGIPVDLHGKFHKISKEVISLAMLIDRLDPSLMIGFFDESGSTKMAAERINEVYKSNKKDSRKHEGQMRRFKKSIFKDGDHKYAAKYSLDDILGIINK